MNLLYKYKNGNHYTSIYGDGTRIRETIDPNDNKFTYDFAENVDVLITKKCDAGCEYCHENAGINGKHGDLNLPIFDTWQPGTEMAIGGGNIFEHPDLISFLNKLRDKKVISNITVNQRHIKENYNTIIDLINNKLIYGLGISLINSESKDIKYIEKLYNFSNNIVIHTIAGILTSKDIDFLTNKKVLILGYKDNVGRGILYKNNHNKDILNNINWLKKNIKNIKNKIKVLSFDNLALSQLDVKNSLKVSEKEWNLRFQGKDYGDIADSNPPSTFYLDTVNKRIGRSSIQPYRERVVYTNQSFEEAFKDSLRSYKINNGLYGQLNRNS